MNKRDYVVATGKLRFKLLAPVWDDLPPALTQGWVDRQLHSDLIFGIQRVRGLALREYGPIGTQLTGDGRHDQQTDWQSWHALLQDAEGRVLGCARYRPVSGGFEQLGASQSALAHSRTYGPRLRSAIEGQISKARNSNVQYGEVGAWALRREIRGTAAAVNIALMVFALAEILGGGSAITTATRLYQSASILRRLGGRSLDGVPAYYEPKYGSVFEILQFDSHRLHPRYTRKLDRLRSEIRRTPVICAAESQTKSEPTPAHPNVLRISPRESGSSSYAMINRDHRSDFSTSETSL